MRMRAKRSFPWGTNGRVMHIDETFEATTQEASTLKAMEWAEEVHDEQPRRGPGRPRTRNMEAAPSPGYLTK